jgi:regulator of sirC expression with transglutaminase-like and TPR domain
VGHGRPDHPRPRTSSRNTTSHNKKTDRFCRVSFACKSDRTFLLLAFLVLTSISLAAESAGLLQKLVRGAIVTADGKPVTDATVEVRDVRGFQIGRSFTDSAGRFEVGAASQPEGYIVVVTKGSLITDQRIAIGRKDIEIAITLPLASEDVAPEPPQQTVSASELSVKTKMWKLLESAHGQFSKGNVAQAAMEVARALKLDPACAPAFTMRAFLRLAQKDPAGAAEDAKMAILLDPHAAESFVALGMAYNSLKRFERAQEAASHALGLHPDSFQGRLELAKSFYGEGHLVLALRELELVGVDFPDVHLVRGNVLLGLDRSAEAVDEFEIFLKEAPSDSRSEQIRAVVAAVRKGVSVAAGQE